MAIPFIVYFSEYCIMKILIINGPNLARLGLREPEKYGSKTLNDLQNYLEEKIKVLDNTELEFFQSNYEGSLIDKIEETSDNKITKMVINPGALTHTSIALRDCIAGTEIETIEVHLTNIYCREDFRQKSFTAPVSKAVISGMGFEGYWFAIQYLISNKS